MTRYSFIAALLFVAYGPQFAFAQTAAPCMDKPMAERTYTRVRLLDIIRNQTPVRAEYLIKTCGVRVVFNNELEADLREAGAEDNVVAAVREVAPKPVVDKKPEPPAGPVKGDVKVNPKDGLRYVFIPHGTFRMGCSAGDGDCHDDEKPSHDVRISKGFWMGQTDVTVEAYKKYVRESGKSMPDEPVAREKKLNPNWSNDTVPMTMVSWTDSRDYCDWAGLRLPTEAEWEYAARGGSSSARYGELDEIAWWGGNSGDKTFDADGIIKSDSSNYFKKLIENGGRPRGVAQKRANAFKLYDMLGNVWQWTADWYKTPYAGDMLETDPQGPPGGERRVLRGGSWVVNSSYVRSSIRIRGRPAYRNVNVGLRCAGEIHIP